MVYHCVPLTTHLSWSLNVSRVDDQNCPAPRVVPSFAWQVGLGLIDPLWSFCLPDYLSDKIARVL